jgi:Fe-S cluster assembly protein SufD
MSAVTTAPAQAAGPFDAWLDACEHRDNVDWLADARDRAAAKARAQGLPTSKSEDWRYTALRPLLEQGFAPAKTAAQPAPATIDRCMIPGLDSHRLVLVNGRFAPELSHLGTLPAGVRLGSLREVLDQDPDALAPTLTHLSSAHDQVFAALNTAGFDDGVVLLLDRGTIVERPIELVHIGTAISGGPPPLAQPRHLISLGAGAQAQLIERYIGIGDGVRYCTNAVLEMVLADDAILKHRRIQLEAGSAFHVSSLYLSQGRGSRYDGVNVGLGGAWARTDLIVRFGDSHAECDLAGLYLAGDRQLIDYHMDVDHALPDCTSRENFKGILYGKGRAVFDGRVFVARDAQRTDAAMSNRNLILSPSAEIDTKPQLEIYADDVKCSHGTTVGQIEPEMLFYLRSRGIAAPLARRMLCLGFAGEIIDALGVEPLREHVAEQVGQRLEHATL